MRSFAAALVVLILWASLAHSQDHVPKTFSQSDLDEVIAMVQDDTYDCRYDDALAGANKIIRACPLEPQGYLYKCGVCWKMLEDGCVSSKDSAKQEIMALIDKAAGIANEELQSDHSNVKAHFYYATSLLYRAGFAAVNHDWFSVLSDGGKAKQMLEKTIELDSSFYDAYSGLGAFNYYSARIPWYVKPVALVLGVSGDKEKGIAELKMALRYGNYSRTEAAVFLGSVVYVNDEDYADAISMMSRLHSQYPDNVDFVRDLCHDNYELRNYVEVVRLADESLRIHNGFGPCHQESLCVIRFYRGKSYEKLNEKQKAIADFEIVVKVSGDHYSGREAKAALDKLRRQ